MFLLKYSKFRYFLIIVCSAIILVNCAKEKATTESEKFEPSAYERARQFADKNPVSIFGGPNKNTNFDFGTSNILWRASLKR